MTCVTGYLEKFVPSSLRSSLQMPLKTILTDFAHDRSGTAIIAFAGAMVPIVLAMGGAIDVGRWINARSDLRNAVDSAVLVAARELQVNGGDQDLAIAAAEDYLEANVIDMLGAPEDLLENIQFRVGGNGDTVTAVGTVDQPTTLLKLIGVEELPLFRGSESTGGGAESKLAVGSNAGTSLEVSLMLDVTGSMYGQKLDDMKEAAKDLIDIVIWEDQSEYTSRVALAPFSEAVNIGDITSAITTGGNRTKRVRMYRGGRKKLYRVNPCATERTNSDRYNDDAPTGSSRLNYAYKRYNSCDSSSAPVVPLSSDKDYLKDSIDGYSASGMTAGHIGTAWAWYLLSPSWGQYYPSESEPGTYSELTEDNGRGGPQLKKIAVLMTDGEYNIQYCTNGVRDKYSSGSSYDKANCTSPNGSSATQARALCAAMKDKGIEVYTVGFQLSSGGQAATTLSQCASSDEHFYMATNGEDLRQSFRDIALKISEIYISK